MSPLAHQESTPDGSTDIAPTVPANTATARRGGGMMAWVVTGMVTIFMMINFADKAVLGLAAADIRRDLGLSATQYGTIASAFFLLFSLSALAVGYLADKFSAKWVLFVLSLVWGLAMLPVLGPAGFGILLVSRVVLGAAEGPAFGIAHHAMQKWFDDAGRSLPASIVTLGTNVGVIISAPILAWLIAAHGWRAAFAALAILSFVWCAAWLVIGREGPIGTAKPEQVGDAGTATSPLDRVHLPLWRILATRSWLGCALGAFAGYWSVALLVAWLPPYLETGLGYSPTATGTLTTLPWAVGGVMLLLQGYVTQMLMRRGVSSRWARGILGGAMMLAAGVFTLLFAYRSAGVLTIALISLGFGLFGAFFAIATTICGEIAPTRQRGAVLGAFVAIYSLSGIAAPYIAGLLVGEAGNVPVSGYRTVFVMSGIILLVGGLLAVLLIHPERDAARLLSLTTTTNSERTRS